MSFTRVCITNNMYCLLQYLLLSSVEEIEHTYFFFGSSVKKDISKHYHHTYLLRSSFLPYYALKKIIINYCKYMIWPFLRHCTIWGQDNTPYSSSLVGNKKITMIEDGVMNYTRIPYKKSFHILRYLAYGKIESQSSFGYNDCVSKIYLTGILPIPDLLKEKVEIYNPMVLWDNCSAEKKKIILNNFNMEEKDIEILKSYSKILFTQPLSEDRLMSEEEKINIYNDIISQAGCVLIKTHPREKTDYKKLYPNCIVFNKTVPFELFNMLGIHFDDVYTVFSTAALTLPYNTKIHFLGTKIHPKLLEIYGDVKYNN